jgi:hypothetical protein
MNVRLWGKALPHVISGRDEPVLIIAVPDRTSEAMGSATSPMTELSSGEAWDRLWISLNSYFRKVVMVTSADEEMTTSSL